MEDVVSAISANTFKKKLVKWLWKCKLSKADVFIKNNTNKDAMSCRQLYIPIFVQLKH